MDHDIWRDRVQMRRVNELIDLKFLDFKKTLTTDKANAVANARVPV